MSLLLRTSDDQPSAAAAATPAGEGPDAPATAPAARACPTCQAPLEADQDWCLQCGAAQSRLGGRLPGMRAAGTVAALTTVLVGGAVAASYAALQKDPAPPAQTAPAQVAQAPQPAPSSVTPTPVDPVPTTPATTDAPIPDSSLTAPDAGSPPPTPSAHTGGTSSSTHIGSSHSSSSSTSGIGSGTTSGSDTTSSGSGTTTTPGTADQPQPIALEPDAGALYDPYSRDTAAGDATKALDDNVSTSFPITVADGSPKIGAGLAVDLGKKRGIRELDLTLKTPGVGLEVYATDEAELPPNVLDSRWAHLRNVASAGSAKDGHQVVTLGKGTTKYRYVLLWFTTPPASGTTVRVTELQILG